MGRSLLVFRSLAHDAERDLARILVAKVILEEGIEFLVRSSGKLQCLSGNFKGTLAHRAATGQGNTAHDLGGHKTPLPLHAPSVRPWRCRSTPVEIKWHHYSSPLPSIR